MKDVRETERQWPADGDEDIHWWWQGEVCMPSRMSDMALRVKSSGMGVTTAVHKSGLHRGVARQQE
jgi:hypothetical protein